jgi:hypothetical protein
MEFHGQFQGFFSKGGSSHPPTPPAYAYVLHTHYCRPIGSRGVCGMCTFTKRSILFGVKGMYFLVPQNSAWATQSTRGPFFIN